MTTRILIITGLLFTISCGSKTQKSKKTESNADLQLSLAQWSLHRGFLGAKKENYWEWFNKMLQKSPDSILKGKLNPNDFPTIAAEYGFKSIELVNVFYYNKAKDTNYWNDFKERCNKAGVSVGLIMCDGLGNLGDADSIARNKAVENHYQWVNIANFLGAHSIRVNAAGQGSENELSKNAIDGLTKLGTYGASKGINIIVENHGGYSSNGKWLSNVIQQVNMNNVGTLPDFGNFCMKHNANGCQQEYDRYLGAKELMPFAKGVSAKSYNFDENGNETKIDYYKMMQIVKNTGYKGYIGIEYEGDSLSEEEGIKATKTLLEKVIKKL